MSRILTLTAMIFASPALAAQSCGPREPVLAQLAERYAEARQAAGLTSNGLVMELFASATGSWTITVTTAEGVTCIAAAGQGYEALAEAIIPPGTPG